MTSIGPLKSVLKVVALAACLSTCLVFPAAAQEDSPFGGATELREPNFDPPPDVVAPTLSARPAPSRADAPAPALAPAPAGPSQATIAATVNGEAITMVDVNQRMRLIMTSSGMPNNDDVRAKIMPQVLNNLIEENLIMQEAKQNSLTVGDDEVEKGFAELAAQNKMTADQFKAVLAQGNIPQATLNSQIRSQIAWTKIIQKKIRPQIEINDNQVDAELQRLQETQGTQEYLIAEIYLPVDSPQQDNDVKQLADRLSSQMRTGHVPFSAMAAQFSQSASASKGGDIGWTAASQLPPQVEDAVKGMKEGDLSRPIRTLTGYDIVLLREKREITAETMPSRDDIRQQIGMTTLDRMQRRYLLNLKSAAFVDRRA